jgi:hypothetical protein
MSKDSTTTLSKLRCALGVKCFTGNEKLGNEWVQSSSFEC